MNILKSICKRFCASIFSMLAVFIGLAAILLITSLTVNAETADDVMLTDSPAANTESQLIIEKTTNKWAQESESIFAEDENKVELKKVLEQNANTVKLDNVVPPIQFKSGKADIPEDYIRLLREVLDGLKNKVNVRLHFIGHTDSVKLRGRLKKKYGNNTGLSRERAGTTAEYFQRALNIPPDAISYDGLGESVPVASNKTRAGKAKNRRVEVQVWYDEIEEKLVEKEVRIKQELKRVKLCRIETVCKLRYKQGHSKRARLKNLVAPMRYVEGMAQIPRTFIKQINEARFNLRDKANVQIKLIGHTDNIPLEGRMLRIYGEHVALSKAQARRVALAIQGALKLSNKAITSDGRGAALPIASNDVETGRAANRRIEVEFWHDDALEELTDEPQLCPENAAAEKVTRVYEPPAGNVKPVYFENGKPVIPPGYVERLKRIMAEISDKGNVRINFIGFTNNARLDRRTAMVYGDDIGLSTARARRVKDSVKEMGTFEDEQLEFEGKGFVHSDDVVNSGFLEFDQSRVEARVLYDDLAALDEQTGVEIERIVREVPLRNPYSLNMMRISVDGTPVDDPGKSSADLQRCTDVELEKAEVQFKFDNLSLKPRLNVSAWPNTARYTDKLTTSFPENLITFKRYTNYGHVIKKSEVRIFKKTQSSRDTPVAIIELDKDGRGEWLAKYEEFVAPVVELKYRLRVYDEKENFDETKSQPLWLVNEVSEDNKDIEVNPELLVGFGENRLALHNIKLEGGLVKVYGKGVPKDHTVWLAGNPVPVNEDGEFTSEEILKSGVHTVEVAILNSAGNGQLYLRDLELKKSDWFFIGLADITGSLDSTNGPAAIITGDTTHYDNDTAIDGRLAFFSKGKFGENWELTASADTHEGPLGDLFTNFMDKSPDALFRRIDPDYYYPTFGDDSTVEEMAPTMGKFYVKLKNGMNYGLWGNFNIDYTDNNLAHVDRNLYGGNIHYENDSATSFGEKTFKADVFAAEPGTIGGRDEFRGTGGSLYFLKHQDVLAGSDRLRIEIRDKTSGLVLAVKNLTPALDYDIDFIQGRVMLSEPLSASSSENLVVDSGNGGSSEVYLVARYEYTSVLDDSKELSTGGRLHYWINDSIKLGATASKFGGSVDGNSVSATDVTLRKTAGTWLKFEQSTSKGQTGDTQITNDGGYSFAQVDQLSGNVSAGASRVDASIQLADVFDGAEGKATVYSQELKAGYSAPGLVALTDTNQSGGSVEYPVMDNLKLKLKMDKKTQVLGLHSSAVEFDADYGISDNWKLSAGVLNDNRVDKSAVIPATQQQGDRTDLALRASYDSKENWTIYSFVQDTVKSTGNRDNNGRTGVGGEYRATEKLKLSAELSGGDLGTAVKLGTDYLMSDRTNIYLNYALENERTDNGVRAQKGNLTSGFKSRFSDSASIYLEERYSHGDIPTGLTHAMGVDLAPTDRLNIGIKLDIGNLQDNNTAAIIQRNAYGVSLGYGFDNLKYAGAIEHRIDKTENPDTSFNTRTTTLYKNNLKYQLNPNWRLISKLNHSTSISSLGDFYNGNFTEAVLGYAYRPIENDKLNALFKYTYFDNLPAKDQVTLTNTAAEYIQKSNILSADMTYDLSNSWSIGAKIARRFGQISLDRVNPVFFNSTANLYIVRADWHITHRWDASMEGRMLVIPEAGDTRQGGLFALYRHFGKKIKLGVGYNFTDFSDDLTDLDYDSQGIFVNFVAKM